MDTKTYRGFAYKQNNHESAPWLISFVARAEDLRTWAGIPRRSDQGLVGFQRADDDKRVLRAKEFFAKHSANQSPTSIVVGIHPPAEDNKRRVELTFDEGQTGDIRSGTLTVHYEPNASLSQIVDLMRLQIESRLEPSNEAENAGEEEATSGEDESEDDAAGNQL